MYAIAEIAGKQYKIEKDMVISVDRLEKNPNDELVIDRILLVSDGDKVQFGQPYVNNAKASATVLGEVKGEKVRGIKFKKRKNYTRTLGHRATYSNIKINSIQTA